MIVVIGAGIIGLYSAYELLLQGKNVTVFDATNIKGVSTNAAVGMLAPLIEARPKENELFKLMLDSKAIWDDFLDDYDDNWNWN